MEISSFGVSWVKSRQYILKCSLRQEQNMLGICRTGSRVSFCYSDQQNILLDIFGRRILSFPDPCALSQLISVYDTDGNFSGVA